MRHGLAICLCARLLLAATSPGWAWAAEEPRSAAQVARQVRAQEAELAKLRERATSVLDSLQRAEDEVRALQDAAAQAEAAAREAGARVVVAQGEEAAAQEALLAQLDLLSPRLRLRQELGKQRRANLLVRASSLAELLRRQRALDEVLQGDLELMGQARKAWEELKARRATLEQVKADEAHRAQEAAAQRAKANRRRSELAALHGSLMEQQDLKEKTLQELLKVQAELSRYVRQLPQGVAGKASFARVKGKMPYPVKGTLEVAFGKVINPKFNTVTFQKGLDLRASEGTEVTAVAAGKVVHSGPFRGYGNLVIVDHGEGYHTLYAHLGSLARSVGDEVEAGQPLGTVGDTGSLKGAYLYFEVRENGQPVDPKEWLGTPQP